MSCYTHHYHGFLQDFFPWKIVTYLTRTMHTKSRGPEYPGTSIVKCKVPDEFVKWNVAYDDYKPVEYTSEYVLEKPVWADPDIRYRYYKAYNNAMHKNPNQVNYQAQ